MANDPTGFTSAFMDDLPDTVLKSLHLITQMAITPAGKRDWSQLDKISKEISAFDKRQLQAFYSEVLAAMDRRYGPVPGLQ